MTDRLRVGGSLSGREKNCAFLNVSGDRFATVSAVSGFDFADDSRGLALVDWDQDGSMDVWVSNRTAPRVRFLKNELPQQGGWIQIGLESDQMVDPIGARVEVALKSGVKLLRSFRAGEGFLSQSSRWLHFGLGKDSIAGIQVRWPDGSEQEIGLLEAGKRHLIKRRGGASTVQKPVNAKLSEGALEEAEVDSPWVRLPVSYPLPPLVYSEMGGVKKLWSPRARGPSLINLWDPRCEECGIELKDWKSDWADFPKDLRILGLMVNREVGFQDAAKYLSGNGPEIPWGKPDESSLQLLATMLQKLFQTQDSFPAPTSFLVNANGDLVAFSRGPVFLSEINSILPEARKNDREESNIRDWAYGKKGSWLNPPERIDLLFVPRDLMKRGQLNAAADYVRRGYPHLKLHRDIDLLLIWIGDGYFKMGNPEEGLKFHLNALSNGTDDPVVMNNVAWQLATHDNSKVRDGASAVKWAEKAIEVTEGKQATYWDTLAAAYAEAGRFAEALKAVDTGIELAKKSGESALILSLQKGRAFYVSGRPYRN